MPRKKTRGALFSAIADLMFEDIRKGLRIEMSRRMKKDFGKLASAYLNQFDRRNLHTMQLMRALITRMDLADKYLEQEMSDKIRKEVQARVKPQTAA